MSKYINTVKIGKYTTITFDHLTNAEIATLIEECQKEIERRNLEMGQGS